MDTSTPMTDTGTHEEYNDSTPAVDTGVEMDNSFNNGSQPTPELAKAGEMAPPVKAPEYSWKTKLDQDFMNSPTMQKYQDTPEGLNDAVKAHLELQKMMGHDKVPVPKGPDDLAAINVFKKAFNIPKEPEGYELPDPEFPEGMEGVSMDKDSFAKSVHRYNLTPEQAKGLWNEYVSVNKGMMHQHRLNHEAKMTEVQNKMRQEWGDSYDTKVELGQMVINKFSEDTDMNDEITALLAQSPQGIKFLAHIGNQFAENKIGDFKYQKHALSPEEAQKEIDAIRHDGGHPYNNEKATSGERQRAIDYVNSLYSVITKSGAKNFR
jgi:hypothetical protein